LKSQLHHPFISSLEFVFQNDYRIYQVSELLRGGDLESLIKKQGILKEDQIKFYTTQLVLVIGFLHLNGIVYRNLKASSVLINSDGYIKLGDFDYCGRVDKSELSSSFSKSEDSQILESSSNESQDFSADWLALSNLIEQMI
jgi:serine/threonine protein kinase